MRVTPQPPVGELTFPALPQFHTSVLSSGARLHVLERDAGDLCLLTVICRGASAEANSPAVSALHSILRKEGSRLYSGPMIADTLDYNGAWLKQSDTAHFTLMSVYCLASKLDSVLPLLRDMIFNPVFPDNAFETRRDTLARTIEISMNDVEFLAKCQSDAIIMGDNHPLARIESPQSIRELSRRTIMDFHDRFISPAGIELILAGPVSDEVIGKIADTFSSTADAPDGTEQLHIVPFSAAPAGTYRPVTLPGARQSAVNIVMPAIARNHPDYLPLRLTVSALGGYFGSRLMSNIREDKGLTYGISAFLIGVRDGAYVQISADTANENVALLVDEVRKELTALADNPPHGDELTRFRRAVASNLAAILETPYSIADYRASMIIGGMTDDYFARQLQVLDAVSPAMISEMAAKYLRPELLSVAVAGDDLPSAL